MGREFFINYSRSSSSPMLSALIASRMHRCRLHSLRTPRSLYPFRHIRHTSQAPYIQRMRSIYRRKAALLQKAYQEMLPSSAAYSVSQSGFYSTIRLPGLLKAGMLIEDLKKENVYVDDARKMYLPEFAQNSVIRLSVSQVEEELIEIGVQTIARVIKEQLNKVPQVKFI